MNGIALYDATMSDGKMNHFCSPIRISFHFNFQLFSFVNYGPAFSCCCPDLDMDAFAFLRFESHSIHE